MEAPDRRVGAGHEAGPERRLTVRRVRTQQIACGLAVVNKAAISLESERDILAGYVGRVVKAWKLVRRPALQKSQ